VEEQSERVIDISEVDMNIKIIDIQAPTTEEEITRESLEDDNFIKRIFVITNKGI